jgi:hypothetical protein
LIESLWAAARLKPHLRQQSALALVKFCVRGTTVGGGLSNSGVGLDGLADGVHNRKRFRLRRIPVGQISRGNNSY